MFYEKILNSNKAHISNHLQVQIFLPGFFIFCIWFHWEQSHISLTLLICIPGSVSSQIYRAQIAFPCEQNSLQLELYHHALSSKESRSRTVRYCPRVVAFFMLVRF